MTCNILHHTTSIPPPHDRMKGNATEPTRRLLTPGTSKIERPPMSVATDAERLHAESVIVDGTCPGGHWKANIGTWLAGGTTCCVVSVGSPHGAAGALYDIADTYEFIRQHD